MTKKLTITPEVQAEIDAGAVFVVNHSGGKDSQAMTIALREAGIPAEQILTIHVELPEVDWDGIPEHIEATLPTEWTRPVIYTRAGKTFFDMVERRYEKDPNRPCFPSPAIRQCTSDLKRGPIQKVVRHFAKTMPQFNGRVVHCIGIRAEESASRSKQKSWRFDKGQSLAGRCIHEWLPIHDWTATDVFEAIAEAGQDLHWAYDAGMSRLSCCFCIMASQKDLQTAAKLRPDLLQRYVDLEERTGFTMSMAQKPLQEVVSVEVTLDASKAHILEAA
jgi:DNA sulfur modification protein DndC